MHNCRKEQIWRNVHAYVDDIVIKSQLVESLISDLQETFKNLRTYQMKLNPARCTFGVPVGKLLGYIVSERGIEANPKKKQCYDDPSEAVISERSTTSHRMHSRLKS